jgi:type III restriction enzyme
VPPLTSKRVVVLDRTGRCHKPTADDGFRRSLYEARWFDREPEHKAANIVDDTDDVTCCVRLHYGELPIHWRSDGRECNADLVVVERKGDQWVVEIKAEDTVSTPEVQAKRQAAMRWVNHP